MAQITGQTTAQMPHAPLCLNGGYAVSNEMIMPELQAALLQEAWEQFFSGTREEIDSSDSEDWRGGCPARRFLTAPGESRLDSLYHCEGIKSFLHYLTGLPVCPSGLRGQYIFYYEPGDYISVHRDVEPCNVVMITCLYDNKPYEALGGTLYFYPTRHDEPLSLIRQSLETDCMGIKLAMGQTLFLFGGNIPHGTIPIVPGQTRVVSTLCFQA